MRFLASILLLVAAAVVAEDPAPHTGRAVYLDQACWQCHQQAKDTAFPKMLPSLRAGPVLDRTRIARTRQWRKAMFYGPRSVAAEATMPGYKRLFAANPKAERVFGFIQSYDSMDGGVHQDGIVTRAEFERGGGKDWGAALRELDSGDGVISSTDAAPGETPELKDLLDYMESIDPKPRIGVKPPKSPGGDIESAIARGRELYTRHCAGCHGTRADGNGVVAMFFPHHPPRNFLRGDFKFRSSRQGDPPTDQDLFRTIRVGAGGSMPAWPQLSTPEIWDLVAYVKSHHPMFLPHELFVEGPAVSLAFVRGTENKPSDVEDASGANLPGGLLVKREGAWWW
ncbi:MAG: c-type cytochrome, partial [Planctomycetota bacterium]|nr:c-type cytochrome [Planctomycetota bacterium]